MFILASAYATPNVQSDQSLFLQQAWQDAANQKKILVIDNVYWVGTRTINYGNGQPAKQVSLDAVNNSVVYFTPNAAIKIMPNALNLYYIINFFGHSNIYMHMPVVYGDRDEHTGSAGEYGHCYNITSCSDIYLNKPKAFNAWGDGYYIGLEYYTTLEKQVENITLYENHIVIIAVGMEYLSLAV